MKKQATLRRAVSTLLRFTRDEQMGLILLFLLVLSVIFVPHFMLPSDPGPLNFEELKRHIDSLEQVGEQAEYRQASFSENRQNSRSPAAFRKADTVRGSIDYKPFVRPEAIEVELDLNTADTTELQQVRGIGGYYARRIVEYRTRLGGYFHIGQLMEIQGIDEERVLRWQKQLKVNPEDVRKIDLSTTGEEELRQHPYIGYYTARGIISFRKTQSVVTLDDLVKNNIIAEDAAERLAPYLTD
ncbi:MAG: helix-hairpin-helix domain-containing protein [Bacteroidales bacterium]|nr:helix-hairpin-helix domain-containing protein [Bacteroidales bacterium]MCL2133102.1 helix-hairpin-helix domain-containing protein [Bacteroidales bacterium]